MLFPKTGVAVKTVDGRAKTRPFRESLALGVRAEAGACLTTGEAITAEEAVSPLTKASAIGIRPTGRAERCSHYCTS